MKMQGKDGHVQAKKKGSEETDPTSTLPQTASLQILVRNRWLLFKPPCPWPLGQWVWHSGSETLGRDAAQGSDARLAPLPTGTPRARACSLLILRGSAAGTLSFTRGKTSLCSLSLLLSARYRVPTSEGDPHTSSLAFFSPF